MERSIIILRLPDEVKLKLQSEGFNTIEDLERFLKSSEELWPLWLKEILKVHKILEKINSFKHFSTIESAVDRIVRFNSNNIAIFHESLANILQGGLPVGQITELCGPPGSGKTQICLQFCVDVQIPRELGGAAGDALYISTDFGFHVERLQQIAQGTIDHLASVDYKSISVKEKCLQHLSLESLLSRINVLRIYDLTSLYEALDAFKIFFENHSNMKLVVLDSFSLPFLLDTHEPAVRTKAIAFFLSTLLNFAVKYKFAIVITNQLVTVMAGNGNSILKPALGQAYAHRIHQRLVLRDGRIYLSKSIGQPQTFTCFAVTEKGIR